MNESSRAGHSSGEEHRRLVEELALQHYGMVYRFCARRVGTEAAADAAQETFVTALRAVAGFRGDSAARTWLLGIALNECRRMLRHENRHPAPLELDPERAGTAPESGWINRQRLLTALNELSDEHREAVTMKEIEGLTYEEVGEVLGVPAGTVKSRVHHAMQQLRRTLKEEA